MKLKSLIVLFVAWLVVPLALAHSQSSPRVDFFSPQGTVKDIRQITVRFSEQIVPFGDPRPITDPFDISCEEKGVGRWADERNWVYDFERNLPGGIRCEFRLKESFKTLAGQGLTGQQIFSFSTGGPAIRFSTPGEGSEYVDEEQIFILGLDADPLEESVLANVGFSVEGILERVGVRIISGQQRDALIKSQYPRGVRSTGPLLLLQARQRFPADARVSLIWGKGVGSKSGVPTEEDQILPFKTRRPFTVTFRCRKENPQSGCIPILPMKLAFSTQVARNKAMQSILRGPSGKIWKAELNEGQETQEFVDYVTFKGPFPEKASFSVEIPKDLTDDAGRALVNADKFPLKIRTEEYPPLAKFPAPFGIIELKGEPVLPVTLRNVEAELSAEILQAGGQDGEALNGEILKISPGKIPDILFWLRHVAEAKREQSVFNLHEKPNKRFKIPKQGGAQALEVVGIPLKEPGFYVVEIASKILGSSLVGKGATVFVPTAALVTNLAVHFKWGADSSLVWVTTLDEAKPVQGAQVQVCDCTGKPVWTGMTEANGIARVAKLPPSDQLPRCEHQSYGNGLFIFANLANDQSFVHTNWDDGIEPWRYQLPQDYYYSASVAHTIFDRTLLRAGETVSMKHIIRDRVMDGFAPTGLAQRPNTAVIEHAGSNQKYEFALNWDSAGTAETRWTIPKDAKLGIYEVRLTRSTANQGTFSYQNRDYSTGQFRVEEFRIPTMKGAIQPVTESFVAPSQVTVDLSLRYLAGGGAANQPVKLRSRIEPKSLTFLEDYEGFQFANGAVKEGLNRRGMQEDYTFGEFEGDTQESFSPSEAAAPGEKPKVNTMEVTLDKAGTARATLSKLPPIKTPVDMLAEMEFRDPSGETQKVSSRIPLWPADRLVGIKPDSWALSKENLTFHVAVVGVSGKPIAGAQVKVEALQRKTYSHRKRLIGGLYAYEHVEEVKRLGDLCAGASDARGLLICETKSPVAGDLILQARVSDNSGREAASHSDVWVAGEEAWWFQQADHDRMDVIPEKKHYEPTDIAKFQVRMPFKNATALITVEREGIMEAFVKQLSAREPVVEIPLKGNYAPNVFVSVLAVRGRVGDVQPTATVDLGRPAYKLGIAEINVKWQAHELKVRVVPEQTVYKVRDKARVKISVRKFDGTAPPLGTEAAIAAVDEGLLELMPNKSWDLLSAMMGRRNYSVATATAQMHVIGKRHFGLKAMPTGGGGGKMVTRELFDTLLLWKPRVPLDENGEATLDIPLNDSLTSFRIVAVASGGIGYFGTGSATIRSMQELMLFSGIAPLVREGDDFRSEFTVRNTTDRGMEVQAEARIPGLGKAPKTMTIRLAPGEAKEFAWPVKAPMGVNALTYDVEARESGGASDRMKVTQKVVSAVPVKTYQATIKQVSTDVSLSVERPADSMPGRGGVGVLFRPKLADSLAGVADYMRSYPYSCMEQLTSRAVALRDEHRWQATMEALPSYLDSAGLVKFFPTMEEGSDILTSYILAIAHEAGWEIPASSKGKMESALIQFVEGRISRYSGLPTGSLTLRKLAAIEALSRWERAEASMLNSIVIDPNLWPTSGVIDWLNVLRRVKNIPNRERQIEQAQQILRSRVNFQGTIMSFSTERSDYLWWLMVTSDANAVKVVLALLDTEQWKPDMPRLVQGALLRQKQGRWNSTVANAWGVLALEKFSKVFESVPVSGKSAAKLAGGTQTVDWNLDSKGKAVRFPWPAGKAAMTLNHSGPGKPWATVQSLAAIPLKQPLSSGYKIKKSWTAMERKQVGKWSRGDLVRVRLELEAQSDMNWVVVNDPIPAGATILGSGLARDSKIATEGEKQKGWAWPAFEERSFEGLRAYYEYVPKGNWTVEYTVRLNQAGTFQLPTTRVEALYAAEMFGEMPNLPVKIEP